MSITSFVSKVKNMERTKEKKIEANMKKSLKVYFS